MPNCRHFPDRPHNSLLLCKNPTQNAIFGLVLCYFSLNNYTFQILLLQKVYTGTHFFYGITVCYNIFFSDFFKAHNFLYSLLKILRAYEYFLEDKIGKFWYLDLFTTVSKLTYCQAFVKMVVLQEIRVFSKSSRNKWIIVY